MEHKNDNHGHHPLVPLKVYFNTIWALLFLTVVTVGVSYLDFGSTANVIIALGVASAKASLVMLFFMGLKYDNNLNRAYMLSSFAALVLLIGISASDLWTRPQPMFAAVRSTEAPLSQEQFDQLMREGAELVAHGKSLYDVNCAVCHGATGAGDGVGGAALNPAPRNFQTPGGQWQLGSSFQGIYVTLRYGIPGTGMGSYQALSVRDRVALTHYVMSLSQDASAATAVEARFAEALKEDAIGAEGAGAPTKAALPIDFAIERVLEQSR
jgi:caa(3)-type oxidase subunit IV